MDYFSTASKAHAVHRSSPRDNRFLFLFTQDINDKPPFGSLSRGRFFYYEINAA